MSSNSVLSGNEMVYLSLKLTESCYKWVLLVIQGKLEGERDQSRNPDIFSFKTSVIIYSYILYNSNGFFLS